MKNNPRREYDFIAVGGGPAGMMAAGRASERGRRVLLLERGPTPGRKLLMTGSGRCNVTNSAPIEDLIKAFGRQGDFLRHAFATLDNRGLLDWLHARGVETVEERCGRVFPASQDARTILDTLTKYLKDGGGTVRCDQRVRSLVIEQDRIAGVLTDDGRFSAPNVLIATGGMSYPATGSAGDGYALAREAGNTVIATYPAIVALETREDWPRKLQGTPIKNVAIRARAGERKLTEVFGEALWTHYGVSGPAILDISKDVVQALRKERSVRLALDLRPADAEDALDERLIFAIKKRGGDLVRSVLSDWLPERTASVVLELAGVEPRKKMNQCSRSDRRRIISRIKSLELNVVRPRPIEEAIVTGGGVCLAEVDAKRMESRLVGGLFFAGEVLDIDGPSGGYNLQAAFSTGYLAGSSI